MKDWFKKECLAFLESISQMDKFGFVLGVLLGCCVGTTVILWYKPNLEWMLPILNSNAFGAFLGALISGMLSLILMNIQLNRERKFGDERLAHEELKSFLTQHRTFYRNLSKLLFILGDAKSILDDNYPVQKKIASLQNLNFSSYLSGMENIQFEDIPLKNQTFYNEILSLAEAIVDNVNSYTKIVTDKTLFDKQLRSLNKKFIELSSMVNGLETIKK